MEIAAVNVDLVGAVQGVPFGVETEGDVGQKAKLINTVEVKKRDKNQQFLILPELRRFDARSALLAAGGIIRENFFIDEVQIFKWQVAELIHSPNFHIDEFAGTICRSMTGHPTVKAFLEVAVHCQTAV